MIRSAVKVSPIQCDPLYGFRFPAEAPNSITPGYALKGRCSIRMSYGRSEYLSWGGFFCDGRVSTVLGPHVCLYTLRSCARCLLALAKKSSPGKTLRKPEIRLAKTLVPGASRDRILPVSGGLRQTRRDQIWSGWRDLNSRPTAPKAVALPGCATPRNPSASRVTGATPVVPAGRPDKARNDTPIPVEGQSNTR